MKKIAAMMICFCLLFTGSVTAFAQTAAETGSGKATISATVPESHIITVEASNAQVSLGRQNGERLTVERLYEPRLLIRPENGYRVAKVTLNGEDVTTAVIGGYYTLPPVYEDKTLIVETEALPPVTGSGHDISGTITDENGNPVSGAAVEIGGKTALTDENGEFTIEDVPDGYHPVTVTDKDGNIIGYVEIEIGKGAAGIHQNENGSYTLTVPENTSLGLELIITEDGKIEVEKTAEITESSDEKAPQTGDNSNIALWIAVILAAGTAMIGIAFCSRRGKYSR